MRKPRYFLQGNPNDADAIELVVTKRVEKYPLSNFTRKKLLFGKTAELTVESFELMKVLTQDDPNPLGNRNLKISLLHLYPMHASRRFSFYCHILSGTM